ncbi:hypothetical protein Tco_0509645 [Tanacetum coccineum]
MWTTSSKLKPKPITDVKIRPKTKPAVLTIYRGNDRRNFDVHNPFNLLTLESLRKRYERLKKIPGELGIQSALSAPAQTQSQSSGKKRKHMELEPEIRIPGLECNKSLPEGVPFFNNMVIEEPEYDMFFNDVFVMASNITTPKNQRFCLKLRQLIGNHPNQEKLKSKKVKLEALGYKLN